MWSLTKRPLTFRNGKFKILQLTDLHLDTLEDIQRATAMTHNLITWEDPDFVMLTGDLITSKLGGKEFYESHWKQYTQVLLERKVPWALALGNHDVEGSISPAEIMLLDSSAALSYSQLSPDSSLGFSTYKIPIYKDQELKRVIWVFDSGQEVTHKGVTGYSNVSVEAVKWYQETSEGVEGVGFVHIPLPEFLEVVHERNFKGVAGEPVCCSMINSGLFAAILNKGDIKGVFVGHDHLNDFLGELYGVKLGYGRVSNGIEDYRGLKRGCRVICLFEEGDLDTYIVEHNRTLVRYQEPIKKFPFLQVVSGKPSLYEF